MTTFDPIRAVAATVLVLAIAATSPAAAQTPVALDRFLVGLERSCRHSPEYRRFANSLIRRESDRAVLGTTAALPANLRPAFGRPVYRDDDGVAIVTLPASATFHGLRVRALRVTRGHEESTIGDGILLDVPLAEARRVLGPLIERSRRGLGEIEELKLEEDGGTVLLECFASN
jgi:hypothetical protein